MSVNCSIISIIITGESRLLGDNFYCLLVLLATFSLGIQNECYMS